MIGIRPTLTVIAALLAAIPASAANPAPDDATTLRSKSLFRDVEQFWTQEVASLGGKYRAPRIVFFDQPPSGVCGIAGHLVGPFYCPINETVYLDRRFLQQLAQRAQRNATLALGYVVAHEVAHHVQNVIGTTALVDQARARSSPDVAARTLTTFELQADCYAGLWWQWSEKHVNAKAAQNVDPAFDAVAAIDQEWKAQLSTGVEMIDSLTHGTEADRKKWFQRGSDGGRFNDCDTFLAEAAGKL